MTQAEKYSWLSLITTGAIFLYFKMKMLDGWSVVDQSAERLIGVYVVVVILAIIAETALALFVAGARGAVTKDERDHSIEAKSNGNAYFFICAAVNVIVLQLLADEAFAGHILPRIDLTSPPTIFFALFAILFAAQFVKLLSTLIYYRI